MRIPLGYDYFQLKQGKELPVVMNTSSIVNGHMILVGGSGMGKSYTLRKMILNAAEAKADVKVRFHVFDVHGDLNIADTESTVVFSEQSAYGLTPLKVNPDPDFGGVRKCIQAFIRTIDQASRTPLGLKQEKVLRSLLEDLFLDFGFDATNPRTWSLNEYTTSLYSSGRDNRLYLDVPFEDKEKVHALGGRWDNDKRKWYIASHLYVDSITKWPPAFKSRTYPSVKDLADYAHRLYRERFLGSDQQAVVALIAYQKEAQAQQKKLLDSLKQKEVHGHQDLEAEERLAKSNEKALEAYERYLNSVKTGHELESLLKYQSPEILSSVSDRISNLYATGIFKALMPPFNESAQIWRYKLNTLSSEEKKMFVLFTLQDIFNKAVQRGETPDVVEVVVLDELGTYTSTADEKGDGVIGTIAREARKFGLALWAANQSMEGVPMSLVSSAGTKIVLGIDESYWQGAITKMGIERKLLEWIAPHKSMAVQFKEKGSQKNRWWWTNLNNKI